MLGAAARAALLARGSEAERALDHEAERELGAERVAVRERLARDQDRRGALHGVAERRGPAVTV